MKTENNSFGRRALMNLIGMAALYGGIVLIAALCLNMFTRHGKEIKVPDFTGLSVPQAEAQARQNKLSVLVSDSIYVRRMAPGAIYRQTPAPGSGVKQGRKIRLVINAVNPKKVMMPNVVGYSLRQATSEIIGAGLQVGTLSYENDFATNNVLSQRYDGQEIEAGTTLESDAVIDLVLGVNPKEDAAVIPDLLGMRFLQAKDMLHDNSLNVGRMIFDRDIRTYADSLAAIVYRQVPDIGGESVRMGEAVRIYLTLDPTKVPVRQTSEEKSE